MTPTPDQTHAFYTAAAIGLRALEAREGRARRFGPDADARWSRFQGALHDGDRFEMLLRDAAATWASAFSGARAFDLPGVASDEPFGPTWVTPSALRGADYLAAQGEPTLDACAVALAISDEPVSVPAIQPNARLVVAGGSAILGLARAFMGRTDLDWSKQVIVVADVPAHRQIAGLASLFVGAVRPCMLVASTGFELAESTVVVISSDADPACALVLGG